ncbi:MAG: peptidoglycan DD-metalloendopeptidase family protein [Erysipelotrichaceae bacterium]|nr:peptidoglycan DD-metalloendopeptidase family protein [Erysipelotrichaceae bacterium]
MKKVSIFFVVCCLVFGLGIFPIAADDYDFKNNEDKYYALCSKTGLTSEEKAACKAFQSYLTEQAKDIQDKINDWNSQLDSIRKDINKVLQVIEQLDAEIAKIERQQTQLEKQINVLETEIASLEIEIKAREENIEKIDEQIKIRMKNMQSIFSINKYIEYIAGANDFVDLIRRTSAINQLMNYDTDQMKLLEQEKEKLEENVTELNTQKASFVSQNELLDDMKKEVQNAKNVQREYYATYLKKQAELEASKRENVKDLDDLQDKLNEISKALGSVAPSAGWIYPVNAGWYISAGAWYYPSSFGGGLHLGVDFAASNKRKVVAVANGVVAYTYDKCTTGGLGNSCGGVWGSGNAVLLLVQVGSHTYGVWTCHMSKGLQVKKGDIVTQGTVLGNVGSTGNSSGNHTHVEIYDLGTMSLQTALNTFARTGDVTFGAGWGSLRTTCDRKGTPCRMNPQKIFNVKPGQSA